MAKSTKRQNKAKKRSIDLISKDENAIKFDDKDFEPDPFAEFTGENMPAIPKDENSTLAWKTVELSSASLKSADLQGLMSFEEIDGESYFGKKAKFDDKEKVEAEKPKSELTEEEQAKLEEKKRLKKAKKKEVLRKNKEKKKKQIAKQKMKNKGKEVKGNTEGSEKETETDHQKPEPAQDSAKPLPAPSETCLATWSSLHIPEILIPGLAKFETATNIQNLTIPFAIRDNKDIIGIAETGSGKTLAFALPLVAKILKLKSENLLPQVVEDEGDDQSNEKFQLKKSGNRYLPSLIMLPTRELAKQVYEQVKILAKLANLSVNLLVGGLSLDKHYRMLGSRPDIVIATPGRFHKCFESAHPYLCDLNRIAVFILDEADRLVSTGDYKELRMVIDEIEKEIEIDEEDNISEKPAYKRQTLFFSATMAHDNRESKKVSEIKKLMNLNKNNLKIVDISNENITPETLMEAKCDVDAHDKEAVCYYLLKELENKFGYGAEVESKMIVFTNTVEQTLRLTGILRCLIRNEDDANNDKSFKLYSLHARMQQRQRMKNIENFTKRKKAILIATDVACRGLDIPKVNLVVHFSTPIWQGCVWENSKITIIFLKSYIYDTLSV